MKKLLSLFIVMYTMQYTSAQNVCKDKKEPLVTDVNDISVSKCVIEEKQNISSEKENTIQSKFSTRRYLKRRKLDRKEAIYVNFLMNDKVHLINNFKVEELKNIKKNITEVASEIAAEQIVSFVNIEQIPQFESCYNSNLSQEDCFNYEMKKHIEENFDFPEEDNMPEGEVLVSFVINKEGKVENIKVTGDKAFKSIKKEITRMINSLPKFIPGNHKGNLQDVSYSFPMSFN